MSTSPATKLYGVVGDPVGHSLSPLIHNLWIRKAGLDAVYVAVHLETKDAAADLRTLAREGVAGLKAKPSSKSAVLSEPGIDFSLLALTGFSGLNITLPHKLAALAAAARASPDARQIGAANTLTRENGLDWSAHNTDVAGFSDALQAAIGNDLKGKRVVLIGAGGAARAAALYLERAGAMLTIVNRSKDNARALAKDLAPDAETAELAQLGAYAEDAAIVVNSASLGHAGASLPALPAGRGRPFLDMSYGKAAEPTLSAAASAGWTAHDGLRMLVGQAGAAFRIWFGLSPDTDGALNACRAAVAAGR